MPRQRKLLRRIWLGLGLRLAVVTAAPARAEVAVPQPSVLDSTRGLLPAPAMAPARTPSAARYALLRARGDLRYHPPGYRPALSLWQRFWNWFWNGMDRIFSTRAGSTTVQWVWYAFLLGTLAWVVLKVLKIDIQGLFNRAPRAVPAYDVELAESPFTDDLAARLADAEARGDFRLAVRLGYLTALRQLADRELIRWLPDKTNTQYLRELPAGPARDAFAALTRQFELAWYGELIPSAADYAAVRDTRAALGRALPASAVPVAA